MLSSRAILRATRASAPQRIAVPRVIASSQIRSYATPATADSKPPKALYGLDGTYATALVCYLDIFSCQLR
jgi:F-type H+-transporting ATPase subunit O